MACGCLLKVKQHYLFIIIIVFVIRYHFVILVGQKVGYSSFQCPVWTYVVIWIVGFIVSLATGSALFVVLMPMFFAFFFAIGLRIHLANRDNIQDFGGCFGEFCCGFWCWYCSVTQSKLTCIHTYFNKLHFSIHFGLYYRIFNYLNVYI